MVKRKINFHLEKKYLIELVKNHYSEVGEYILNPYLLSLGMRQRHSE